MAEEIGCVEKKQSKQKTVSTIDFSYVNKSSPGWVRAWVGGIKGVLKIAYRNQKAKNGPIFNLNCYLH